MILHRNMEMLRVKIFKNMKKLEYKKNKLKLDIDFLTNCKQFGVYPISLSLNCRMFPIKMLYQFVKDFFEVPLRSVIKNYNIFQRNQSIRKPFMYTAFYYWLLHAYKTITSYNNKLVQKSLNTQQKKLSSLTRDCNLHVYLLTLHVYYVNIASYETLGRIKILL